MPFVKALVLGLLLCLVSQAQALADEKKARAVEDFTSKTIPSIQLLAPFIAKNSVERRGAFGSLEITTKGCNDAFSSALSAHEDLAYDAAKVCLALRTWMQNNDAGVCQSLAPPTGRALFPANGDGKIKRGFKDAQVEVVYTTLLSEAGCKGKDKAYWANRSIDDYMAMEKQFYGIEKADLPKILPQIIALRDSCFSADLLSNHHSKASESAMWGCVAIHRFVFDNGAFTGNYPCFEWYTARNIAKSAPESDPFFDKVLALRVSYHSLTAQTGCEAKVQEYFSTFGAAEAQADEDAKTKAQYDSLMSTYTSERKQADDYMVSVNAWEDRATAYLANGEGRSASLDASVCDYYKYTRNHVYEAQVAARDIYVLRPTDSNKSRLESEQRNMKFLNSQVDAWCK